MAYVFISYSHKNKEYARKLAAELDKHHIEYWMDDRIDYGSKWLRVIQEKLEGCQAVIVILSTNAYNSDWVQNEIAFAQQERKEIYPVLLEGKAWVSLASAQYADVRGGGMPPDSYFEDVKKQIGTQATQGVTKGKVWESLQSSDFKVWRPPKLSDTQGLRDTIVDRILKTINTRSRGEWEIGIFRITYSVPEKDLPKESQYYGLQSLDVINTDLLSRYEPKFYLENKEGFDKYAFKRFIPKDPPSASDFRIPSLEETRNQFLFRKRLNLNLGLVSKNKFTEADIENFAEQLIDIHQAHHIPILEIKIKVIE